MNKFILKLPNSNPHAPQKPIVPEVSISGIRMEIRLILLIFQKF